MFIRFNLNFRINYITESRKPSDIQISIWLPYPLHQCWFYNLRSNHLSQHLLKRYWGTKEVTRITRERERERERERLTNYLKFLTKMKTAYRLKYNAKYHYLVDDMSLKWQIWPSFFIFSTFKEIKYECPSKDLSRLEPVGTDNRLNLTDVF